ncbi:hypothetical protein DV515_00003576 [Chloebia gouldiae]|uniref:Uncharacterized protein n=1 Tax=Chloebia gouldiae TaxID=44316 RepID=A0A3L8STX9_CHLGU|nr:hypothetical protein DV515_00003576 [Chloebia gouldiae]
MALASGPLSPGPLGTGPAAEGARGASARVNGSALGLCQLLTHSLREHGTDGFLRTAAGGDRGWRRLKDEREKLRAPGEAPGDWEAARNPGRGRRAGPGRIGTRILPAGLGAGAAGPCPVP